jgi:transcriptional/translational regulatory protein YebC/TACO1
MFDKKGLFAIDKSKMSEEAFMELALEIDAEDISIEEESFEIYSQPEQFAAMREQLENRQVPLLAKELAMLPQNQIKVEADHAPQLLRLMEALEDQEDVQHVWANFDIDAEVLATTLG